MEGYPDRLISGGIDWFEWSGFVDFSDSAVFDSVVAEFQRVKECCQAERRAFREVDLPNFGPVRVYRHGINRGGERGQHFEFRLRIAGVMIGLSSRRGEALKAGRKRQQANVYVLQTGRDCLLVGATEGHGRAMKLISALGGSQGEFKMSRGDLCLDVTNLPVAELNALVEAGHFVTLARTVHPNINYVFDCTTGFTAGKSPLRLSVYDKMAERMGKADILYLRALIDRRWYGGANADAATRIEYQMRRPWLLEQGITSPEDFLNRRGALCSKLTHDWFRLTEQRVDRRNKHQSRAATHPVWVGVQKGFEAVFGEPEGPMRPIRREKIQPMKLAKQGRGCLAKSLLQMGMTFDTYVEFAEMAKRLVLAIPASEAQATEFIAELESLKMEFETS